MKDNLTNLLRQGDAADLEGLLPDEKKMPEGVSADAVREKTMARAGVAAEKRAPRVRWMKVAAACVACCLLVGAAVGVMPYLRTNDPTVPNVPIEPGTDAPGDEPTVNKVRSAEELAAIIRAEGVLCYAGAEESPENIVNVAEPNIPAHRNVDYCGMNCTPLFYETMQGARADELIAVEFWYIPPVGLHEFVLDGITYWEIQNKQNALWRLYDILSYIADIAGEGYTGIELEGKLENAREMLEEAKYGYDPSVFENVRIENFVVYGENGAPLAIDRERLDAAGVACKEAIDAAKDEARAFDNAYSAAYPTPEPDVSALLEAGYTVYCITDSHFALLLTRGEFEGLRDRLGDYVDLDRYTFSLLNGYYYLNMTDGGDTTAPEETVPTTGLPDITPVIVTPDDEGRPEEELRELYPELFSCGTMKGLEVYYAVYADGTEVFTVLPGTNRMKTEEEVMEAPFVTLAEMRTILRSYEGLTPEMVSVSTFWNGTLTFTPECDAFLAYFFS